MGQEHRWSGWPGAWCLDCGVKDANEIALADGLTDDVTLNLNKPCREPGSNRNNPYTQKEAVNG
mgnify:FL=1